MKNFHKKIISVVLIIFIVSAGFLCCCFVKAAHAKVISSHCHQGLIQESSDIAVQSQDGRCDCKPTSKFLISVKNNFNETIFSNFQQPREVFVLEKISLKPSKEPHFIWDITPETLQNSTPAYLQKSILRL